MRALVVDDSRTMRTIISRILDGLGFDVTQAADGQQAVELLAEGMTFDLGLVDWNMPRMSGLDLVTHIRANPSWESMRLVMVTTESERDAILLAISRGADEYVIKPFTSDALVEKLGLIGMTCATA